MGLSNFCQRQPLSGVYAKVAIIVGIANNYGDVSTALARHDTGVTLVRDGTRVAVDTELFLTLGA